MDLGAASWPGVGCTAEQERKVEGEGGGSGGEGKGGPQVNVEPGPLRVLLRHCQLCHTVLHVLSIASHLLDGRTLTNVRISDSFKSRKCRLVFPKLRTQRRHIKFPKCQQNPSTNMRE